jgi:hypothetical protein
MTSAIRKTMILLGLNALGMGLFAQKSVQKPFMRNTAADTAVAQNEKTPVDTAAKDTSFIVPFRNQYGVTTYIDFTRYVAEEENEAGMKLTYLGVKRDERQRNLITFQWHGTNAEDGATIDAVDRWPMPKTNDGDTIVLDATDKTVRRDIRYVRGNQTYRLVGGHVSGVGQFNKYGWYVSLPNGDEANLSANTREFAELHIELATDSSRIKTLHADANREIQRSGSRVASKQLIQP